MRRQHNEHKMVRKNKPHIVDRVGKSFEVLFSIQRGLKRWNVDSLWLLGYVNEYIFAQTH